MGENFKPLSILTFHKVWDFEVSTKNTENILTSYYYVWSGILIFCVN